MRNYAVANICLMFLLNTAKTILHEFSHAIAAWLAGGEVKNIIITVFGGSTIWTETVYTIPPSSVAYFYLAGVIGEMLVLLPLGSALFFRKRAKKGWKLVGYWLLMLLILSTGYWCFCAFFCKVDTYDPIGFSIYANVDLELVGSIASIPFFLIIINGVWITIKWEKDTLVDPSKVHLWTLALGFLLLLLTGDVV